MVGTVLASGFSLPMLSFGDFVFSNSHEQVKYLLSLDQVGNDCALYRAYYQGWRRQSDYFRCGTSNPLPGGTNLCSTTIPKNINDFQAKHNSNCPGQDINKSENVPVPPCSTSAANFQKAQDIYNRASRLPQSTTKSNLVNSAKTIAADALEALGAGNCPNIPSRPSWV